MEKSLIEEKQRIAIDLFCGAGGMSLGFEQTGFNVAAAIDSDLIHLSIYRQNFPECRTLCADLSLLSGANLRALTRLGDKTIDVVFGGPPCNGFSVIGKRRLDDPRNQLLVHFARLVEELAPKYFIVENVRGLLMHPMTEVLQIFLNRVEFAGYSVVKPIQCLDANDFGVPQKRSRIFILGSKQGFSPLKYPAPLNENGGHYSRLRPKVWDAISDLPNIDDFEELLTNDVYFGELKPALNDYARMLRGEIHDSNNHSFFRKHTKKFNSLTGCLRTLHTSQTVQRFAAIKPGTTEPISHFYRLAKEKPSLTLRAGTDRSYGGFTAPRPIHPVYPRCISVREGARIHSFPDWFRFHPTKWHGFRQVGNAVPPLLARAVAQVVFNKLNNA